MGRPSRRSPAVLQSWCGPVLAAVAICLAVWLASVYAQAKWVEAGDIARIKTLQEQARTDPRRPPEGVASRSSSVSVTRCSVGSRSIAGAALASWRRSADSSPGFGGYAPRREAGLAYRRGCARPWNTPRSITPAAIRRSMPIQRRRSKRRGVPQPQVTAGNPSGPTRGRPAVPDGAVEIRVGLGSCGLKAGAAAVGAALVEELEAVGGVATVKRVGCTGACHAEPVVEVVEGGRSTVYAGVKPSDARQLVRRHVRPRGPVQWIRAATADVRRRLADDGAWVPISSREVDAATWMNGPGSRCARELRGGSIPCHSTMRGATRDGRGSRRACRGGVRRT